MNYVRKVVATAPRRLALSFTVVAIAAASGCFDDDGGSFHSPASTRSALTGVQIDARVLVLTAGAGDINAIAVAGALQRLGTPYDLIDVNATALTADMLASSGHGHYQAVFLSRGDLVPGSGTGTSALSNAEWQMLTDYEAQYGVRRVSLYTFPDAGYGYTSYDIVQSLVAPFTAACTAAGAQVLRRVSCASGVALGRPTVNAGHATDAGTVPLLVDGAGRIVAATRAYPDGREALTLNFNQEEASLPTMQVLPDVIAWGTRGLYLGERHTYVGVQIDDLFNTSELYTMPVSTYRITADDMQTFYDWQQRWRQQPNQADFRTDWAINALYTGASDPLTLKATAIGAGFKWINHTWDHQDPMDGMSFAKAYDEFNQNSQKALALPLTPYSLANAVTPSISGLKDVNVMMAAYATGIRYLISDSSYPDQDNPSFNAGLPDFAEPRIFLIPRHPTEVNYNGSTPAEVMSWFNSDPFNGGRHADTWADFVAIESDILLDYLLRGENDPWMFHQANVRVYDAGTHASVLSDVLDATFTKYNALLTFPFVSPPMEVLGAAVKDRTTYNAAHVAAVIEPGVAITVQSDVAAVIPVTGGCVAGAESYAGDMIAHVSVPAGGSVRLDISACSMAPKPDGGSVSPDADLVADAAAGTGGTIATGTGGTSGTDAAIVTGTGGATVAGTGGAIVPPGTGGATGVGGAIAAGTGGKGGTGGKAGTGGATPEGSGGATPEGSGGATPEGSGGTTADAAIADTGTPIPLPAGGGCSCTTAPTPPPGAALGLLLPLALAFARQARPRRATTSRAPRRRS